MSGEIKRHADGNWYQGEPQETFASDHTETWSGTRDKSMDHVSDEYAKQTAAQKERNLKEEAHQLGLSSWDRVDKWLKSLNPKIKIKKG